MVNRAQWTVVVLLAVVSFAGFATGHLVRDGDMSRALLGALVTLGGCLVAALLVSEPDQTSR